MRIAHRGILLFGILVGAPGCGRRALASPPSLTPPAFLSPAELLPGDLDVVLRFDLKRLRAVLSNGQTARLLAPDDRSASPGTPATSLFGRLPLGLAERLHATTLWIGFRGLLGGDRSDLVCVLQGDLRSWDPVKTSGLQPAEQRWRTIALPAPGVAVYERGKTADRSAPVRLALLRGNLAVLVSAAEVDAFDRVLRFGPDPRHLDPPADGLLGFSLRPRAIRTFLAQHYGAMARLTAELTSVGGSADWEDEGIRAETALAFQNEAGAERTQLVLRTVLTELAGSTPPRTATMARSTTLRREGPTALRLQLRIEKDEIRTLFFGNSDAEGGAP